MSYKYLDFMFCNLESKVIKGTKPLTNLENAQKYELL